MKKIGMRAKKKDPGDWCENGNEDREPKCSHYPMKSTTRWMSTSERGAAGSGAQKVCGRVE